MIETGVQILIMAMVAVWFAELSMVPQWVARRMGRKRIKPFDCALCIGWWTGLLWFCLNGEAVLAIPFAASTSVTAVLVAKTVNRL